MLIKLYCPNGHKLSVDDQHAGQKGVCPKCQSEVLVPQPRTRQISDSSIMAALGDYVPNKSLVASPGARAIAPMRGCPKCNARISTVYRRCPHCQTYLPASERNDVA
jgi:uncharacterized protein with PIN domain